MRIFKLLSIYTLLNCVLIVFTVYDFFAHGIAYQFLGITGVFLALLGIAASVLFYFKHEIGRVLLKNFAFVYVVYYLILFIIESDAFNPVILVILLSYVFLFFKLSDKKIVAVTIAGWKNSTMSSMVDKKRPLYLRIGFSSIFPALLLLLLLGGIWFIDWEDKLGILLLPNGSGIDFYRGSDRHPVDLSVAGGFVYDDRDVITIKLTAPDALITAQPREDMKIALRVLNVDSSAVEAFLDGAPVEIDKGAANKYVAINNLEIASDVNSGNFLAQEKGVLIKIKLTGNTAHTLRITNRKEEQAGKLVFYAISDTHSVYTQLLPEIKKIMRDDSRFIVFNGDMVNNGYDSEYVICSNFYENMPKQVFTTIGNHDIWNGGGAYYTRYFGPNYYSFIYENTLFIFLDTSAGYIGNGQFTWLRNLLAENKSEHIMIFSHMSPINTYIGKFDDSQKIHPELLHNIHRKSESDYLLELAQRYGVDYVIAGHSHIHAVTKIGKTTYVTSGVMGGSVTDDRSTYSYLRFEIDGAKISFKPIIVKSASLVKKEALAERIAIARIFLTPLIISRSVRLALSMMLVVLISIYIFFLRKYSLMRLAV